MKHPDYPGVSSNKWRDMDTAPRDGTRFLAWCIERPAFSPAPTEFIDFAHWSGHHFASRSGAIPTLWQPLPDDPARGQL
jgi:hypothetical protein